jgi:hypothetical protein
MIVVREAEVASSPSTREPRSGAAHVPLSTHLSSGPTLKNKCGSRARLWLRSESSSPGTTRFLTSTRYRFSQPALVRSVLIPL